jgi:hypothetical protein
MQPREPGWRIRLRAACEGGPRRRSDIRIERDFQFNPFDEIITLAIAIDKSGPKTYGATNSAPE